MAQELTQQERESRVEELRDKIRYLDLDMEQGKITQEQCEEEQKPYMEKLQELLPVITVQVVWLGSKVVEESHKVRGRWEVYHLIDELASHCEEEDRVHYVTKGQALLYEKFPFAEEHERVVAVVNW